MKQKRLIAYIMVLTLIISLAGIQPGKVYAATNSAMLGGQQTKGNLRIDIANGNIDVYRYDGRTFVKQYYAAADAILDVNGSLYALGTYFSPNRQMQISSFVANQQSVITTWRAANFELTQMVTLPTATAQYIQLEWSVRNTGSTPMTNLHFLRGEDTFLAGGDNGAGYWDEMTNSIGVSKVINGVTQRLYMQGITIPNSYISAHYMNIRNEVARGGVLSKTIDPNEGTDNGYALEWKNDRLNPNETWTIRANECFVSSAVLANGTAAVTSVSGGAITVGYAVTNSSSTPQPVTYSVEGPQGWNVEPDITSDIIAPHSQGRVNVLVTPPTDAANGTYNIILNVTTQDSTSQSISTVTIAEPLAAPNVTVNDVDNILVGADSTMEYSEDGSMWTSYNSSNPPVFIGNKTIQVRVKGNAVTPASEITTVSFTQAAAPVVSIDDENDVIVGINDTMEYSTDGGTTWNSYNSSMPPVFKGNKLVQVRVKATQESDASAAATLVFHADVAVDDVNNRLENIDSTMEYSVDNGASWTAYDPANVPTFTGGTTVLVRKKAGDSVAIDFSSHTVTGSALTVVSGSAISISGSAVTISGSALSVSGSAVTISGSALAVDFSNHNMAATDDTMEYSEDNGNTWIPCAPASEINVPEETSILVRKKPGGTRTVVFTDNPSLPPSPVVIVDSHNNTILGADNTMEYSTNGGGRWIDYNTDNPPVFRGNTTVQVRKKAGEPVVINYANGTITGSDIHVIADSATSATGSALTVIADFTNKKLVGVYETMEYSTDNGRTWRTCTSPNLDFASNSVVLLRKKAGEITTLNFTAIKPAAPAVRKDDNTNTIIGADNSMEYSTDGGVTWISYNSSKPPVFKGTVEVKIRVKASGDYPAGEITTLNFYPEPTNYTESDKKDTKPNRQVEMTLDSVPIASIDIIRSKENNKAVDSVTVDLKTVEEVLKNRKAAADKITVYVKNDVTDPADEVHYKIKADALKKLVASGLNVEIKSDDAAITLSKDELKKLADQNMDLYFKVKPVKDSAEIENMNKDALSSDAYKKYEKYRILGIFGTPMKIDTNYDAQKIDVVFSTKNLTLPKEQALREKVLKNLAVYVAQSDGDKKILPGTLVYDKNGTLVGVKTTIDKFGAFQFISTINTAPSISKLTIKKADTAGEKLKVTYSYKDADQDKEGNTKYQWYRADNKAGKSKTKIALATKSSYAITKKDLGKYLICGVIPGAKDGALTGRSYTAVKYVPVQELKEKPVKETSVKATDAKVTKDNSSNTASSNVANDQKATSGTNKAMVKLGVVGSERYAQQLAGIFQSTYKASQVEVKAEGNYYRVSAGFLDREAAEKACQQLKRDNYIINYSISDMK